MAGEIGRGFGDMECDLSEADPDLESRVSTSLEARYTVIVLLGKGDMYSTADFSGSGSVYGILAFRLVSLSSLSRIIRRINQCMNPIMAVTARTMKSARPARRANVSASGETTDIDSTPPSPDVDGSEMPVGYE
jgi:hypothetical protein